MKSTLPKVLHTLGGRPMLGHVLAAGHALKAVRMIVVTSPGADAVAAFAGQERAEICVQERQLGTAHAVLAAQTALAGFTGKLLILFGDTPLVTVKTLEQLIDRAGEGGAEFAALGFRAKDPTGYGRMIAEGGTLTRIVEHKDATEDQRRIDLCNAGPLAGPCGKIFELLRGVGSKNAQGEFYLTDVFALARSRGIKTAIVEGSEGEMAGVNSRAQLAEAEIAFQGRRRAALMDEGVSFAAPETVFLNFDTVIEPDSSIGPYVVFGPGAIVRRGAEIRAFCHIEGAEVKAGAIVGPFARLRPGAVLEESVHVGNFVEIKNARLEKGAKANHLAYVGDARVGAGSNIGAGTITCNYDGTNKHRTDIGAGVFVGSNSTIVAPVTVGDDAYIAAGSTITDNVPKDALALGRARQVAKPGLAARLRERLNAAKKKKDV